MQSSSFITALGLSLAMTSAGALAAPNHAPAQQPGGSHDQHQSEQMNKRSAGQGQVQHQAQGSAAPQRLEQGPRANGQGQNPGQKPSHNQAARGKAQQPAPQTQQQSLPRDFTHVQQQIHQQRDNIGRGPARLNAVQLSKGQPLPQGWGRPLNNQQLRYVPQYQGHQWRSAGADMVLVNVASNLIAQVLIGVLN
jgi:hypothetical protein